MNAWKRTFVSSFTAKMLSSIGFSFAMPFLPFFIAELGVYDESQQAFLAGLVLSSSGFTFAIFAPVWGVFADRYGRKLMLCRAMLGGTVIMFLISAAQSVGQLVVLKLLQGVFSGTMAASVALVASVVPQRRSGMALGMMQAAIFIGTTIGPFFGGIVADAFGYRVSFQIGALLCLLGGLLVYFGAREDFSPEDEDQRASCPGFRQIFMLKGFFVAVLLIFGVRFSNTIVNPSFPLIVRDIIPSSPNLNSITGSVMAAAAVAGAVSAAVLGHMGDRIGHRKILIACCAGASIASAGHFFAYSLNRLFLARILFGLSVAGMLPAANAAIHSIIDRRSIGKAYGLATSISMLGAAFGPMTGGYLAKIITLRAPFLFTAALQALLGIIVVFYFRTRNYSSR